MRKIIILFLILSSPLFTTVVFAQDVQYTIQEIWMDNPNEELPTFSQANDFNDAGYVVGRLSEYPGQFGRPFWWRDGSFLPILPAVGGGDGAALDINDSNQFVGTVYGPSPYHENSGFFVDNGVTTIIPYFVAQSIDSSGNVYGRQEKHESPDYVIPDSVWSGGVFSGPATNPEPGGHGDLSYLGNLMDKLAPGYDPKWQDIAALGVLSNGQIVGNGSYDYSDSGSLLLSRALILTPVVTPEPASMALFGLGAGALVLARRWKKISK